MHKNFCTLILFLTSFVLSANANYNKTLVEPYSLAKYNFFEEYKTVGQIKFSDSQKMVATQPGKVEYVTNLQGQEVKAGTKLISINEKIITQAREAAEANYKSAKSSYERDLSLFNKKIISEDLLNKSRAEYENSRLAFLKAEEDLRDMVVTAPFDGIVGVIRHRIGDEIKTGDTLLTIFKKGKTEVVVDLPQALKSKITENTKVFGIDTSGNKVAGRIIAISDYLSVSGTFAAKIEFSNGNFLHDSFIDLLFIYNEHEGTAIPEKAVLRNNTGHFVFHINKDNIVQQVYINLGTRTGNYIELISDKLNTGDKIVLEGLTKVNDGFSVNLIDKR